MNLHDKALLRDRCFVNGQWSGTPGALDVTNPADGSVIASVPRFGADETRTAIEAADAAMAEWRGRTAGERATILHRWCDLMNEHREDLAVLMTTEQGKPLDEARGEVGYAASFLSWFAEEGRRIYGDIIPEHRTDSRLVVTKEPIGVCAAITPWNFPLAMVTRKAGAALAAGCTMVLKPAESTPLSALALAELGQRAGLPNGVFNVVIGDPQQIGGEITSNPIVRKVTFTGSTAVGKLLMEQCATTMKKVSLELGGNAPFIVFDDADMEAAVEGAIGSKYRNTGQTCVCANRILVHDAIYDRFAEKLVAAAGALTVGSGTEEGVKQGPLINEAAVEKVEAHIADAVGQGARVLVGGKRHERGGTFFQPTVLADVNPSMRIASEETFGPVAPLFRFHSEKEAVAIANATEAGLAAYFYTRDMARIWRMSRHLEYGIVGINTGIISTEVAPFGGMKESGIGREGSKYGLDEFLEIKYLCMGGIDPELQ